MHFPSQWRQSYVQWRHFPRVAIEAEKRAGPIDRFPLRLSPTVAAFDHRRSTRWTQCACATPSHASSSSPSSLHGCAPLRLMVYRRFSSHKVQTIILCTVQRIHHTPRRNHLDVRLFFYLLTIVPSVRRVNNLCACTHTHTKYIKSVLCSVIIAYVKCACQGAVICIPVWF